MVNPDVSGLIRCHDWRVGGMFVSFYRCSCERRVSFLRSYSMQETSSMCLSNRDRANTKHGPHTNNTAGLSQKEAPITGTWFLRL